MTIAAGGILERQTAEGPKIAVVYRDRHGPEWSLPKGKVNPDEPWEEAALREIKEETGCSAIIRRYVGTIDYLVEDSPKVVFFWHMALEAENAVQDSNEVKRIVWLVPEKAFQRLTHKNQRDIINKVYHIEQMGGGGSMSRLKCIWVGLMQSLRWRRLASSIHSYREELPCIQKLAPSKYKDCFETSHKLLDEAQTQLERGFIDRGWKLFHAARRMELVGLYNDHQRRTNARQMSKEAEKIPGWRGNAIKKLVGDDKSAPSVEELYQAALIRDEHYANNAYKSQMLRAQAITLAAVLFAALLSLLLWLKHIPGALPNFEGMSVDPYQVLITVGLFGVLGGTVSAITSVPKSLEAARIPEMTTSFQVTFLRLFMGFASAIVIFLVLHSGLADKIFSGILSEELAESIKKADPYTSYFIAFCAGFSERLVKRAVEYVAGK